jgi:hypothetical protein
MALKKTKLITKMKNFFIMNWWLTGISNIIMIVMMLIFIVELGDVEVNFEQRLNRAMENSIIATPDGRVAIVDKQFINTDSEVFINYIGQIVKTMEASESILTNGFNTMTASRIVKPSVLLNINEDFSLLYKEFFIDKKTTGRFLRYYYTQLKKGELPKKISILSTEKEYRPLQEGGFEIRVTLKIQKDFINKTSNRAIELITKDIITVRGIIDPSKYSTSQNPYGVKFYAPSMNLYLYSNYEKGN